MAHFLPATQACAADPIRQPLWKSLQNSFPLATAGHGTCEATWFRLDVLPPCCMRGLGPQFLRTSRLPDSATLVKQTLDFEAQGIQEEL